MAPQVKIISGGQTGVDRAALDFALKGQVSCGGWCPDGRTAEDGVIPLIYPLKETLTANTEERTFLNVAQSDGLLIIFRDMMDDGTLSALKNAKKLLKDLR